MWLVTVLRWIKVYKGKGYWLPKLLLITSTFYHKSNWQCKISKIYQRTMHILWNLSLKNLHYIPITPSHADGKRFSFSNCCAPIRNNCPILQYLRIFIINFAQICNSCYPYLLYLPRFAMTCAKFIKTKQSQFESVCLIYYETKLSQFLIQVYIPVCNTRLLFFCFMLP